MTQVPQAALKKAQEAEELHRAAYASQDTLPDGEAQQKHGEQPEPSEGIQNEQPTPAVSEPGHVEVQNEYSEENYRRLQAQHKTLQGKYSAEIPRLTQRIRDLEQQLSDQQGKTANAVQKAQDASEDLERLRARMNEEIGEDASSVVGEYATAAVREGINKFKSEQQKSKLDEFWDSIYDKYPNFNQINTSEEFTSFLHANTDDTTGLSLHFVLNEAGQKLDSVTVNKVVGQFIDAQTRRNKQPSPEDHVSPKHQQGQKQVSEPKYTLEDWNQLQDQLRKGQWVGREAEAAALERDIHAALMS